MHRFVLNSTNADGMFDPGTNSCCLCCRYDIICWRTVWNHMWANGECLLMLITLGNRFHSKRPMRNCNCTVMCAFCILYWFQLCLLNVLMCFVLCWTISTVVLMAWLSVRHQEDFQRINTRRKRNQPASVMLWKELQLQSLAAVNQWQCCSFGPSLCNCQTWQKAFRNKFF